LIEDSDKSVYCYKGTDAPNPGENGRPSFNLFIRNVCRRSRAHDIHLRDADFNRFIENIFEDSISPLWQIDRGDGNQFVHDAIPDGQILDFNVSSSAEAIVVTEASIVEDLESGAVVRLYPDIEAWFDDTGSFGNLAAFLGTTPRNIAFGNHSESGSRVTMPVALRNLGAVANLLGVVGIRVAPGASGFSVAPVALPVNLAGTERADIAVEFDPGAAGGHGPKQASIELDFTDGSVVRTSTVAVTATVEAGANAGQLTVTPMSLDFGVVFADAEVPAQPITLTNSGAAGTSVLVESLTVTDPAEGFSISPGTLLPLLLASGESEEIWIDFDSGASLGVKSAALVIGFWNGESNGITSVLLSADLRENPQPSGAFLETGGILVFDAEHFESSQPSATHRFDLVTVPAGFAGSGAMLAAPNVGGNVPIGELANSPWMNYAIVTSSSGDYFFWYRTSAANTSDDSFYASVGPESAVQFVTERGNDYAWREGTIAVPAAGEQTFRVWMREDGLTIDKFVLTTDSQFVPAASGPPESPRTGGSYAPAMVLAESLRLLEAWPNPFRNATTIDFDLPSESWLSVEIFSIAGRRVCTLARGVASSGRHTQIWSGRDDGGMPVAPGVYFLRVEALNLAATLKLVRVR
jgi:hypothetical protein